VCVARTRRSASERAGASARRGGVSRTALMLVCGVTIALPAVWSLGRLIEASCSAFMPPTGPPP
jgi:hypothetical protein